MLICYHRFDRWVNVDIRFVFFLLGWLKPYPEYSNRFYFHLSVSDIIVCFGDLFISYTIAESLPARGKSHSEEAIEFIDEKQRWYMRFERLLNRAKKVGEGLAKSSLSVEDKAEIWAFFWNFYSGIGEDLEKQYPELKRER